MIDTIKLLEDLVAIPSMNLMGGEGTGSEYSEGSVANFLASFLSKNGIDCETYEVRPGRKNLVGVNSTRIGSEDHREAPCVTECLDDLRFDLKQNASTAYSWN